MNRLSKEDIQYLKYQIYQLRYDDPWISNKKAAKLLNRSVTTVNRYAQEAEQEEVIHPPQPRLKQCPGKETALLLFENKYKTFNELMDYPGLTYLCVYQGDWNIAAMYDAPLDFSQFPGYIKTVVKGPLGEVIMPKVPYISWEKSFGKMEQILQMPPAEASALNCNTSSPGWDEEDWVLYHYFMYDLRMSFNDLRKKHAISWRKYQDWKKNLKKHCTILVDYYPQGYNTYNGITTCFHTKYEQYIVDLFSHLPTTPVFYKVGTYLCVNMYCPKGYEKEMRMFKITSALLNEGVIKDSSDGYGICHWLKDFEV